MGLVAGRTAVGKTCALLVATREELRIQMSVREHPCFLLQCKKPLGPPQYGKGCLKVRGGTKTCEAGGSMPHWIQERPHGCDLTASAFTLHLELVCSGISPGTTNHQKMVHWGVGPGDLQPQPFCEFKRHRFTCCPLQLLYQLIWVCYSSAARAHLVWLTFNEVSGLPLAAELNILPSHVQHCCFVSLLGPQCAAAALNWNASSLYPSNKK